MQQYHVLPAALCRHQDPGRDPQLRRLIIRPGAIGDLIVSLPALEHLRADYTEVWVSGPNVPLVRFADRVRSIASTGLDMVELGRPLAQLETFESIVSWYGTARPEFRDAVAHLPVTFHDALPRESSLHAVDFYLQQVGAAPGAAPRIECAAAPRRSAVVHPFSGSARKNWPLDRFLALADRLPLPVEFTAGPEEPFERAVRFEDLYDLACWLAGAALYIGNDSGITHLAAAVGVPVIALFGPTDPRVWSPRGFAPVHVIHRQPIDAISIDEVAALARTLC